MPRHTHARHGERIPAVVRLVVPDPEGRVRLSGWLWAGRAGLSRHVSLSPGMAYELGRELVDAAESVLMEETWPSQPVRRDPAEAVPAGAGRPSGRRSPASRPGVAVDFGR